MYSTYGASPRAFVPHSAINLSVKTPDPTEATSSLDLSMTDHPTSSSAASQFATAAGYTSHQQNGSSPQILDLTRQEPKRDPPKSEQTEPVDFSSNTNAYTFTSTSSATMAGSFSTTESSTAASVDSLNRYRSNPTAAASGTSYF
jgi:hypothetical protein